MNLQYTNVDKESSKIENQTKFPIACIGSSAGGIEALSDFLSTLSDDTGIAYIIIQHLDPSQESQLTNIISKLTTLPVISAGNKQELKPDYIFVIPSNKIATINNGTLLLEGRSGDTGQLAIDSFMRSLATELKSRAIGIILSGVGSDGSIGIKEIKAFGGITFIQDFKSAKYDGMPKNALATSCVDFVMKPSEMPLKLGEIVNHEYLNTISDDKEEEIAAKDQDKIASLFELLHEYSGIDFTNYKRTTIRRRILRRLAVNKLDSLDNYIKYTKKHKPEIEELYQDLLIGVTSFFREPESYEMLTKKVFPELFDNRMGEEPIRIWVPGCSSGEEVYSILMCLIEYMKENDLYAPIQAFGTDINDSSLSKARKGFYVGNISIDVSTERLKQFFLSIGSRYQIKKTLRNLCIFAKQDLIGDPPFPRIDLISCRNMLIYLNQELQEKVISNFHYALKPKGILILGISETVSNNELFNPLDKKYKIYLRSNAFQHLNINLKHQSKKSEAKPVLEEKPKIPKWEIQSDQILLTKYSPAAVVVDGNLDILQFRGQDNPFLCIAEGMASLNLTKMTREGLSIEIRKAMQEVKSNSKAVRKDGITVQCNDKTKLLDLEIIPLKSSAKDVKEDSNHFLITFLDSSDLHSKNTFQTHEISSEPVHTNSEHPNTSLELALLEQKLNSTVENYEFINKELQSANDEILSTNEELRIINEEFETAKEELQSSNEELTTVNEELQNRIHELNITNEDFGSLFGSINIPIIVLDLDFCITRLTSSVGEILGLSINDIGRDIRSFRLIPDLASIENSLEEVLLSKKASQHKITDLNSNNYLMNISPYIKQSNIMAGLIIDFQLLMKI